MSSKPSNFKRVILGSHWARQQFQRNPTWLEHLIHNPMSTAAPPQLAGDEAAAAKTLRQYRNQQMLGIIWRDLNRLVDSPTTCAALSQLADSCIQAGWNFSPAINQ